MMFAALPPIEGMEVTIHTVKSIDGAGINISRFVPQSVLEANQQEKRRAIVYCFGGGHISGSAKLFTPRYVDLAESSATQVFGVDYRLAPEHPAPASVEDVYSAVAWLSANATTFNVDPARILIMGGSSGGGVAAGTALMAPDKGLQPPLAGQLLIYPMLNDRTFMTEENPISDYLIWTVARNDIAWKAYLGKDRSERTDQNVPIYAAPARAKDLSGLPPTYIDIGSLDLFRDECIDYAGRLAAADNDVEFHLYAGMAQGWEEAGKAMGLTKNALDNRMRFIASI